MNEAEERAYIQGRSSLAASLIGQLGLELPETLREYHRLVTQHAATVNALRDICREFGDNDWPDDLYLPDVIVKHLRNHLETTGRGYGRPENMP